MNKLSTLQRLLRKVRRLLKRPQTWVFLAAVVRFIALVVGLFDRHD